MAMREDNSIVNSTTTNWEISAGSIDDTVTFESPLSLINNSSSSSSSSSSPLVLRSLSSDSDPCEITIHLDQKYEIRQVYIRSTARVYEIYYASDLQNSKEYLCTVRCGIAYRDDEVFHVCASKEVVAEDPDGSSKHLSEHKSRNESRSSSSEDDWVEVKVPDGLKDSLPSKFVNSSGGTAQIYYEATAEVEDVNPCRSITLRLLSLQDKGCLYVDEVYVFADPVDTADMDTHTGPVDNSAGSSLMTMLVPTLLQLSRSSGINQIKERDTSESRGNSEYLQTVPKAADINNDASRVSQEKNFSISNHQIKPQVENNISILPGQEITRCLPDTGRKHDSTQRNNSEKATEEKPDSHSFSHVERALDQLISRVSKIENLFLSFEEKMVKPINRIEGRLQQVEQKLEELSKFPKTLEVPHCTRISAPEFSDSDLDSKSPSYSGSENVNSEPHEQELFASHDDLSIKLIPSLVITAPEFSTDDEDEESSKPSDSEKTNSKQELVVNEEENAIELDKDLNGEKPKQRISVDDALASAFAGFVLSTSVHQQNYVQTLAVKAPEFPSEEGSKNEDLAKRPVSFDESSERELEEDSDSASVKILSVESEETTVKSFSSNCSEGTAELLHDEGAEGCDLQGTYIDSTVDPEKNSTYSDISERTERTGSLNGDGNCNLAAQTDRSEHYLERQIDSTDQEDGVAIMDTTVTTDVTAEFGHDGQEGVVASPDLPITIDGSPKQSKLDGPQVAIAITKLNYSTDVSNLEALRDVLKLTCTSSSIDFQCPVLDVKFTSQGNPEAKISIKDLFGDVSEGADIEKEADGVPCISDCKDRVSVGSPSPSNLITVEDAELVDSAADAHFSLDMDYLKLIDAPTNSRDESLKEMSTHGDQELSADSLI